MLTSAAVGQLEDDELSLSLLWLARTWHGPVFRHGHMIWDGIVHCFAMIT